jgi:hypothetical protein
VVKSDAENSQAARIGWNMNARSIDKRLIISCTSSVQEIHLLPSSLRVTETSNPGS